MGRYDGISRLIRALGNRTRQRTSSSKGSHTSIFYSPYGVGIGYLAGGGRPPCARLLGFLPVFAVLDDTSDSFVDRHVLFTVTAATTRIALATVVLGLGTIRV